MEWSTGRGIREELKGIQRNVNDQREDADGDQPRFGAYQSQPMLSRENGAFARDSYR